MTGQFSIRHGLALGLALASLTACGPTRLTAPSNAAGLTAEVITVSARKPAKEVEGECWDTDIIPAVIETVTEQRLVSAEVRDASGTVIQPATYSSTSKLRMVQDRSDVWFRTPCPEAQNAEFWASVQRALKARGYYLLPLTGQNDPDTAEAVRRFQAERGLDSSILSLAAARELGLVAVPLSEL
jgi:Putative peptidoglycan binding domain